MSGIVQIRISMFAERVLNELLAELVAKAKTQIGR